MMITSTGSNAGMYTMGQIYGRGNRPDPAEKFAEVDTDGSGGLDQTEFQTLADKISEVTGEETDVEALFATYDENGDGVLSENETRSAMEANRPQGPPTPPPGGMMGGAPPDLSQLINDADENEDGTLDETEAETLADFITQAASEEVDAADLLAAHDENDDGVLSEEEAQAVLEAHRPEGFPPHDPLSAQSEDATHTVMAGIDSYMKMAALGMASGAASNITALFGDTGPYHAYASETLPSISTQA